MENHDVEKQSSGSMSPDAARNQLRVARQAQDASARRATVPAWCILALSVFCGVQTIAPAYRGPGNLVTIIAFVWLVAALLTMGARHQWRPFRSWPQPRWSVAEVALMWFAALLGGVIGPHLLARQGDSAVDSWGIGTAVTVVFAACMFAAYGSYRHRASRVWRR
jgi:hypothetical protein